jgi:hypothetical protein
MRRHLYVAAIATGLPWAAVANAQPGNDAAHADASFNEAMQLRSAGRDLEACPKFAESQRLAPGVGVTLYLADCYERTGRTASAWQEFRAGEKLARQRNDKRADVAARRADALEPKLNRLTVAAPAGTSGADVQLDGKPLPAESWNVALAVDPGDHVVTVAVPGQPVQTFNGHVDASNPMTTIRLGQTEAAPSAAPGASQPAPAHEDTPPGSDRGLPGRAGGVGLMLAGAAGIGIGTWLVTDKTREVMPNGQLCEPHLRKDAIPGAAVAFSAGGLAVVSGIVLYYVNRPGRTEVSLTPSLVPGGGGAVLRGSF